jgi:hypothetical protein
VGVPSVVTATGVRLQHGFESESSSVLRIDFVILMLRACVCCHILCDVAEVECWAYGHKKGHLMFSIK